MCGHVVVHELHYLTPHFEPRCWAAMNSGVAFVRLARSTNSFSICWTFSSSSFSSNSDLCSSLSCFWSLSLTISSCFSTSFFTMLKWPICAAMNKGVAKSSVCEFGSAAKDKSKSTTWWWPFWHATYKGVALVVNGRSTWAPCSSRNLTASKHPPWLEMNKAVAPPLSLFPAQSFGKRWIW